MLFKLVQCRISVVLLVKIRIECFVKIIQYGRSGINRFIYCFRILDNVQVFQGFYDAVDRMMTAAGCFYFYLKEPVYQERSVAYQEMRLYAFKQIVVDRPCLYISLSVLYQSLYQLL